MAGMTESTLDALRITVEGPVTSFRHPHLVQGVQPTYDMPPPATIYGHVCSALGRQIDPAEFQIGVCFASAARFMDYEHIHLFGKESKLSPFRRELLFQPRLTLYIDRPDWREQFRQPRYVVALGRSQDLMAYTAIDIVQLELHATGYLEQTLIPLGADPRADNMVAVTMPRFLTPDRTVTWGQYAIVKTRQPARK